MKNKNIRKSCMYDGLEIAKYIIVKYNSLNKEISNLKLQKILFYVELVSQKLNNESIITDDFEAWRHGPVIRDVYNEFKIFLGEAIDSERYKPTTEIDKAAKEIIDKVIFATLEYSDWELANISQENSVFKEWYVRGMMYVIPKNHFKDCQNDPVLKDIRQKTER